MKIKLLTRYLGLLLLVIFSCKKQGPEGLKSLIDIKNFSSNQSCPAGGLVIKTGIDKNRNNILDSVEVDDTKYVCNGQNGTSDKQISLPLNYSANTTSTIPVTGGELIKFSKRNYTNVDSIIFVANPYVADITNTAILDLYNITDNVPISNSRITTNSLSSDRVFLQTGNVYNAIPDKEITLGISLKSGNNGMFAASGSCYLILYRK